MGKRKRGANFKPGKPERQGGGAAAGGAANAAERKDAMIARLESQGLGAEMPLDELRHGLDEAPATAVRFNPAKPMPEGHAFDGAPVSWNPYGLCLRGERPRFTLDPCLHQGRYYVQDASSMFIYRAIKSLGLPAAVRYLDACAAPGGKTQCAVDALGPEAFVTANEPDARRFAVLRENMAKWGAGNVAFSNLDSRCIEGDFDVIAVDAPCSGEGMMRKESVACTQWCPELIAQCSALQKEIVTHLWQMLAPGGYMIYSTCTFNREENDDIVAHLIGTLGASLVELPAAEGEGALRASCGGLRFIPGISPGEGLFMAALRKPGTLVGSGAAPLAHGPVFADPNEEEQRKLLRADYQADPSLAWEIGIDDARAYLRREALRLPPDAPAGIITLLYEGLPLGRAKNIGSRANNLYPSPWRIRQ